MVARPTPRSAVYAGLGHSDAHNACNRVCAALAHHRKGRLERRREWPAAGLLKESTSQRRSSATSAASARTPAACLSGVFSVKNNSAVVTFVTAWLCEVGQYTCGGVPCGCSGSLRGLENDHGQVQ